LVRVSIATLGELLVEMAKAGTRKGDGRPKKRLQAETVFAGFVEVPIATLGEQISCHSVTLNRRRRWHAGGMERRMPIPLRPDPAAMHAQEQRAWQRAIAAHALATLRNDDPNRVLRAAWPSDDRVGLILRAAQTPTTTANFPAHDVVAAFRSLAPGSAALALFELSLKLDLRGVTTVRIPDLAALPPAPVFVEEGKPGPALEWSFAATVLGPVKKILVMSAVTNELNDATADTAAAVIAQVLATAANKSIDAVAFGSAAATTAQPAGLLHNVTPITAATGGADTPMFDDLANLIGAIGSAGINPTDSVFVAGPREAAMMKSKLSPQFENPILMTLGLPAKSVACFAPAAVVSGYQDAPSIETSREAVLHMEDTTPLDIGTAGGVAAPSKSTFQTDLIAIKVRANCAWAVSAGGAQVVNTVNW
jgi:hypothetical protein